MHFALVDLGEIVLHVAAGQRGSAEQHRELLGHPAGVHLLEVFLHHHRRLHQQPRHAHHVGALVLGYFEDGGDRLLDADVDHLVAVVGQDDVDEVLADVVHVALDGRQHDPALARVVVGLLHVRLQVRHSGFHHLGGLQDERQLHLAGAEQFADGLHAGQQVLVDDLQRRLLRHRLVEVCFQPVALAVDDALRESFQQRQFRQFGCAALLRRRGGDALEHAHEFLQWVVAIPPAVIHEIQRDFALLLVDPVHRQDLATRARSPNPGPPLGIRAGTPS